MTSPEENARDEALGHLDAITQMAKALKAGVRMKTRISFAQELGGIERAAFGDYDCGGWGDVKSPGLGSLDNVIVVDPETFEVKEYDGDEDQEDLKAVEPQWAKAGDVVEVGDYLAHACATFSEQLEGE